MRFLTYEQLKPEKGIPWSRRHIMREVEAGRFPPPMQLGPKTFGWLEDVIDEHLAQCAQRQTPR